MGLPRAMRPHQRFLLWVGGGAADAESGRSRLLPSIVTGLQLALGEVAGGQSEVPEVDDHLSLSVKLCQSSAARVGVPKLLISLCV